MNGYARTRILGISMLILWIWVLHFTEDVIHLGLADWCERVFGSMIGIGIWSISWLIVIALIFRSVVVAIARQ